MKSTLVIVFLCGLSLSACRPWSWLKSHFSHEPDVHQVVQEEVSANQEVVNASKGSLARANSELLAEMIKVTFDLNEIEDRPFFGSLAHSLNEGASLEGIHRGLLSSSRFRSLETSTRAVSPKVLRLFANELYEVRQGMRNPTPFDRLTSKKPMEIEFPSEEAKEVEVSSEPVFQAPASKEAEIQLYLSTFIGATHFTLKRILTTEALKKMDEMKDSSGEFAQWYAKMAIRYSSYGLDLGLPQRSDPNFDFHFKFAQTMAMDRVRWEVLNRIHRYINLMNREN